MINLEKSLFYLHEKTPTGVCNIVKRITEINKGTFPLTYLGCSVFYEGKKRAYFEELIKKVMKRLILQQHKLSFFGERYILIVNVLQLMPIYLLSARSPPVSVINHLHKIFAQFIQAILLELKISIGFLGIICVIPKRKGVLVSNHFIQFPKLYVPSYGGNLELQLHLFGVSLC